MNIIGDIAGQFKTLEALLAKMPKGPVVSLGDMVDRGPQSKEVLNFFKSEKALLGNHEHMMIDAWEFSKKIQDLGFSESNWLLEVKKHKLRAYYQIGLWLQVNGGLQTVNSYLKQPINDEPEEIHKLVFNLCKVIPLEDILYLKSLPLFLEFTDLFLSHAPKLKRKPPEQLIDLGPGFWDSTPVKSDSSLIWNRAAPAPYGNKLQVFGHNAYLEVRLFSAQFKQGIGIKNSQAPMIKDCYAVGLDTSEARILSGIHYPSLTIYQQEYLD